MDIHRKLQHLEQQRRRAGQMRQLRRLAQQPNVRELKQRRRRAASTAASSTEAKVAGPETAGERPLPRPIQAAATSLAA